MFNLNVLRQADELLIDAHIGLEDFTTYDTVHLSFYCGGKQLAIIKTSAGHIVDNSISSIPQSLNVIMEYSSLDPIIECIAIGINQGKEVFQDILSCSFDNSLGINYKPTKPRVIQTMNLNYDARMNEFFQYMTEPQSKWKVHLHLDNVIKLQVQDFEDKEIIACVGDPSVNVQCTDLIFKLYPTIKEMFIPLNAIQNIKNVGVFELVSPDFVETNDLFYKIPISNIVKRDNF